MKIVRRRVGYGFLIAVLAASLGLISGCRCAPVADLPMTEPAVWPLTGEEAPDADAVARRAVSVKVENARQARPQSGVAQADVVYESLSEGGITRFNVLFHSRAPEYVGPVRSARVVDTDIVTQYDALFAYSGASRAMRELLATAGIADVGFERYSDPYQRIQTRSAPHNLYTGVPALIETARNEGMVVDSAAPALEFGDAPDTEAPAATAVDIPFSTQALVSWEWDAERGRYERFISGQPHADEGDDEPYSAANVIVIHAQMTETGLRDSAGNPTLDIELTGTGDAVVFRDGLRYDAIWTAQQNSPPRFQTRDGVSLPLAVGKTWIEIVPVGFGVDAR